MRSLAFKFTLVLVIVSLLGIAFVAVVASQVTEREFANFLGRQGQSELVESVIALYETNGSWGAISQREWRSVSLGGPGGSAMRMYTIADTDGIVVAPSLNNSVGTQLSRRDLMKGQPIKVDGEVVGIIVSQRPLASPLASTVESFTESINQSLLMGTLIAVGVSLLLGLIFSRTLTHQLGQLSKASQEISKGDLNQRVEVKSKDEIGQLAETFNQMSADLEQSRELRQQITADIAHELRTPLSIILGRAETLAEGMLPPSQEVFEVIHEEALRVNRLVEDLRTLSLSDAGELSLEMRPVSVTQILEETRKAYSASADSKHITLQVSFLDQLPSIEADPDRLGQVLGNLVSNALRYTPEGGNITLSATEAGSGVEICVINSGSGIPPEEIPQLFDRFYRGDKARERDKGGSGLGLAIAKSLVNAHGGNIQVKSQLGAGTTFAIWLPVSKSH